MDTRLKIIIADDHPLYRQGLRQLIEADARFELLAETDNGEQALTLLKTRQPDIAVLDISMPGLSGLEVAAAVQAQQLPAKLIVLTMLKDEQVFNKAMSLGVCGYVLKENAISEIISCLTAVIADQPYVSPSLTGFLLRRHDRIEELAGHTPALVDLTVAERRILKRIADKKTTREIAAELFISPRTVETHRANISTKLSLKGSNALLQFALENRDLLAGLQ